ncbi:LysR family transcriptional regulator [Streptomyces sp. NPDC006339]|uniref:LysR family transcriptional regulator n=1 Tax=Streptomyces sp. NPDC006339 TaxID=3156755 RepID=UPI0033BEC292
MTVDYALAAVAAERRRADGAGAGTGSGTAAGTGSGTGKWVGVESGTGTGTGSGTGSGTGAGAEPAPLTLRQWRYFVAVATERSFSGAAVRCRVSQPTLSQQIKSLETLLETPLFVRGPRGVQLTPAAERLLPPVTRLLEQAGTVDRLARALAEPVAGELRLGYTPSVHSAALRAAVSAFREAHPEIRLSAGSASTAQQLRHLAEGRVDAAFVRTPLPTAEAGAGTGAGVGGSETGGDRHWNVLPLEDEPVLLVVREDHPLATADRVAPSRLWGEPLVFVAREHSPGLWDSVIGRLYPEPPEPWRLEPDDTHLVATVAEHGGVSLVTASTARLLRAEGIRYKRFTAPEPTAPLALVWSPDDTRPELRLLVEFLRRRFHPAEPAPGK